MSPSLRRVSSTVSFYTSEHNTAGHSHHPIEDGDIVEETAADKISLVGSAIVTQTAAMSLDAMSFSSERASSTVFFHPLCQRAAGHSLDRIEDAPHHPDACNVVETGAGQSSRVDVNTRTQTSPAPLDTMLLSPERILSTVPFHSPSGQSAASHSSDRVEDKNHTSSWFSRTREKKNPTMVSTILDTTPPPPGTVSSTVSFHTSNQSIAGHNCRRIKKALCRKDMCNVVIFGQTGAGKSSLVNLIAGARRAPTSSNARACTTKATVYRHDVKIQDSTLKVQLFDTAGLDEDCKGTVLNKQAQTDLKKLLRTPMPKGSIHLLLYCVQGTRDTSALQRNYNLMYSEMKGRVPVVLVVTGLEDREPEMEEWWRINERSISDLGMNFAGHACITTLTISEGDTDGVRQRHEQSYLAICNLIEHCRLQNGIEVSEITATPPARKTKNIVLFGEAGAGKSSVVNLMAGREVAITSLSMRRCTLHWQDYAIDFDGGSYKVFDTIGIEESGLEMKEYLEAVANAFRFIKKLDAEGGVDLLLFCVRAGRFTAALQSNYRFFHEFLCEKKVPIVLAITNLEREQRMEDWWDRERSIFARHQIQVADHACITAANGLEGVHQRLYEESRIAIRNLVKQNIVGEHNEVWTGGNWNHVFVSLVRALKKILVKDPHIRKMNLTGQLTKCCGMPRETAGLLADMIEHGEVRVDTA